MLIAGVHSLKCNLEVPMLSQINWRWLLSLTRSHLWWFSYLEFSVLGIVMIPTEGVNGNTWEFIEWAKKGLVEQVLANVMCFMSPPPFSWCQKSSSANGIIPFSLSYLGRSFCFIATALSAVMICIEKQKLGDCQVIGKRWNPGWRGDSIKWRDWLIDGLFYMTRMDRPEDRE